MSGICGIMHFDGASARSETLTSMIDAAEHRGPDGIGTWRDGSVGLAHLALNVTPESEREDQPLVDRTADCVLVADARIDNRDDLTSALRDTLRTDAPTDADLILAAYRKWGLGCAERLIGDFAFAIWDERERHFFAARDPMAMRPFYYRIEEDRLLFGSEVKQILAAPEVPMKIFDPMVAAYLQGRFDPLDWTFYEDIAQLKPAHALVVEADGSHRTWRYWDIDPDERIRYDDEREYVEHFRELFAEAVRCRLRSIQPVGLLLSGGLDSGSIASMAGHLKETEGINCPEFRTYSWKFPTLTQCDERHISDQICERYDLPATYIDAEASAPLADLEDNIPDLDEPFIGVYHALLSEGLRQAKSEGVGCMFSGHRGDLLVGNWIFDYLSLLRSGRWVTLWKELKSHEEKLNVPIRNALRIYLYHPLRASLWPKDRLPWLRKTVRSSWYTIRAVPESSSPYPNWIRSEFKQRIDLTDSSPHVAEGLGGWARRERYKTIHLPMHMRTATWTNRLFAKHQISFRDPWDDRRLIEFAMAVPQRTLSRNGENKRIMRNALKGIMPDDVRRGAGKIDPSPLYHSALKTQVAHLINRILFPEPYLQRIVNRDALQSCYEAYCEGQKKDHRLWYTLTFGLWLTKCIGEQHEDRREEIILSPGAQSLGNGE